MNHEQQRFTDLLASFIRDVDNLPRFRGKAQVLTILRRIPTLAVFR